MALVIFQFHIDSFFQVADVESSAPTQTIEKAGRKGLAQLVHASLQSTKLRSDYDQLGKRLSIVLVLDGIVDFLDCVLVSLSFPSF